MLIRRMGLTIYRWIECGVLSYWWHSGTDGKIRKRLLLDQDNIQSRDLNPYAGESCR